MQIQKTHKGPLYKIIVLLVVVVPFLAVLSGMMLLWNDYFFLSDLLLFLTFMVLAGFGVTIGYHRMLTHTGFETPAPIKAFFLMCGCMAWEGGPITWAATHIVHHAHSDDEHDPHSPVEGFWHAHLGWVLRSEQENPRVYAAHLYNDRAAVFVQRTWLLWSVLALVIPFAIGGWTGLLWGGLVRIFYTHHVTWSVNSICHTFGKRQFETTDESRNNWLIGLLAFGEGWHNNHHAFPTSAFHGMRWYQFDLSGIIIRTLEKMGLVWKVQRVSEEAMEAHRVKSVSVHENIAQLKEDFGRFIDQGRAELNQMWLNLPPQKVAAVRFLYEEAMQQCADVQLYMARRRNMKKAALERRRERMTKLIESMKQRLAAA